MRLHVDSLGSEFQCVRHANFVAIHTPYRLASVGNIILDYKPAGESEAGTLASHSVVQSLTRSEVCPVIARTSHRDCRLRRIKQVVRNICKRDGIQFYNYQIKFPVQHNTPLAEVVREACEKMQLIEAEAIETLKKMRDKMTAKEGIDYIFVPKGW